MRKLRLAAAAIGVLALGLGGSAATASASAPAGRATAGAAAGSDSPLPPDQAWTVTLITGDVVQVRTVTGGLPLVSVQPRPGRGNVIFSKFISPSGQIEVLPQDVVPLLGRVLDPALFDVTTLIANGDDNAHRSYLPLIVQGESGPAAAAAATAAGLTLSPGTRPAGAGTVTADEPLTDVARMGQALASMATAVLRAGEVTPLATGGIRHIWLAQSVQARDGAATGSAPAAATTAPTVTLTLNATPIPGTAAGQMNAVAFVVDTTNPALFDQEVSIDSTGTATLQVPAGTYFVSCDISDFSNPSGPRAAWVGQPELAVSQNTTVALDGADTVPVTASVTGHPTVLTSAGFHIVRSADRGMLFGGLFGGDIYAFGSNGSSVAGDLFAQPTGTVRTGTFQVATDVQLSSPAGTTQPYVYDLYHPVGNRVPKSLVYTATRADQASFARFGEQFYAINGNTAPYQTIRYGLTTIGHESGGLTVEDVSTVPGGSALTEYLSTGPGLTWSDEAAPPLTPKSLADQWVIELPGFTRYAPGSQHTAQWARQPFRPGPYSGVTPTFEGCAPYPTLRFPGLIHVGLTDLQDEPDGYDCLGASLVWPKITSRTMQLYMGSQLIGTKHAPVADFVVPEAPATYTLVYTDSTSRALPVSTQTQTTWTFRSGAPPGGNATGLPLLLVDYDLPLGLDNHPDGSTAVFSVGRMASAAPARVTGFELWTSLDNGTTWQAARVHPMGRGRFAATLPNAASGQAVALRVQATDDGGSGIEQTIMAAYFG
jgi:hypothetical protein